MEDIGIGEVHVHVPLSGPDGGGDIGLARTSVLLYCKITYNTIGI